MHDVAVVGAGPGGAMAAWRLCKAGLNVILLDQKKRVGVPVQCGEALSALALESNLLKPRDDFVVREVRGVKIISPNGTEFAEEFPGFCIKRGPFDRDLVDLAVEEGTDLRLATKVMAVDRCEGTWRLTTQEDIVEAQALVAADGPKSKIGVSVGLGRSERKATAVQYKFKPSEDLRDDYLRFYCRESFIGGYAWSFDRDYEVNVGVVSTINPRPLLDSFCRELGLRPKDRIGTAGGLVPQGGPNPTMAGEGIVTVGDAAGLTNPCTSGGIHAALYSGRIAADILEGAFYSEKDLNDLSAYEQVMRESPFCDPNLIAGRKVMDDLSDGEWDLVMELIETQDFHRFKTLKLISHLVLSSPSTLPSMWRYRTLGAAYETYSIYGW